ncbi:MAG: GNAT family N-acetyltransferase [Candidatus Hodarchaeales archaeon]|jgi:GNAT superfamily N-acetyltransferase
MKYKIEEFDPTQTTEDFWDRYLKHTYNTFKEMNPNDPLPSRERVIKNQTTPLVNYNFPRWLVFTEENQIIAWGALFFPTDEAPEYEENKHLAGINIIVQKEYRKIGVGSELLKVMISKAKEHNKTIFEGETSTESGNIFCQKLKGIKLLEGAENRLYLSDVNWETMIQWKEEGPRRAKGVQLKQFNDVPEQLIKEYVAIYTETMMQQPLGESEVKIKVTPESRRQDEKRLNEIGTKWTTIIAQEKDGTISGLTEITYNSLDKHKVIQGLTGTKEEYRGRGLGKWLKAEMILYVKEKNPEVEFITSGNADSNAPMMSINKRMGFKTYQQETSYKFKVKELCSLLEIET